MNEFTCGCGQLIARETIMEMLDALATHMLDCAEGAKEPPIEDFVQKRRPYPSRALYRGITPVNVIGYAGGGDFIIIRGNTQEIVARRHLTFTRQ